MWAALKPQINHDMDFVYQRWELQLVRAVIQSCAMNRSCGPQGKACGDTSSLILFFNSRWGPDDAIKGVTEY